MTPLEAVDALGHLVVATPGWSDATCDEYTDQLATLTDAAALERACKSIARAWSSPGRPPIAVILESYDRECLFARALDPVRVHCDGSGWRWTGGTLTPCPRCQPALTRVWEDPDKLLRYRGGHPIEWLDVGVERVSGHLRYTDGHRPPSCTLAPDGEDEVPTVAAGLDIAWAAYAAEQESVGTKPRRQHFNRLVRTSDDHH